MIRTFYTLLVILGLVFQPYAFFVSTAEAGGKMDHSLSSMDMSKDASVLMNDDMPCEKMLSQSDITASCDECCDINCSMISHCVSSAKVAPFATNIPPEPIFDINGNKLSFWLSAALTIKQSSFIYHPPKLS